MFLQARHRLDEIARAEAVVELVDDDALPGVAAGARRAGQSEQIGATGDTRRGPTLDRRGPDLLIAEPAEELAEAGNLLLVDAVKRLGVASRPVTPVPVETVRFRRGSTLERNAPNLLADYLYLWGLLGPADRLEPGARWVNS
jgi:hypothetical protein